jgi:hypothetical protein
MRAYAAIKANHAARQILSATTPGTDIGQARRLLSEASTELAAALAVVRVEEEGAQPRRDANGLTAADWGVE